METKEYLEKVMQDFNQNRRGRNLRKYCSDEGIDYKQLSEYKKQYSFSKGKVEKEEVPSLIPLQVIDEHFSEQPVVQPEAKWCVKQLVIASPTGDELEVNGYVIYQKWFDDGKMLKPKFMEIKEWKNTI